MWILRLRRIFLTAFIALVASIIPLTASLAQQEELPVISPIEQPITSYSGISFDDPQFNIRLDGPTLDLPYTDNRVQGHDPLFRGVDLNYGSEIRNFDVQFAARSGYGFNNDGQVNSQYQSRELRLGRNLERRDFSTPAWYFFVADEDEALTLSPNYTTAFGEEGYRFGLQDQVSIGDMQVGVAYEWNGWQTSFSYVEREVGTTIGNETYYEDENFIGLTVTYRHEAP